MKIKTSLCAGAALGVFAIAGAAAAQDTTTAWKGAPQWTNDDVQFKVRGRVLLDTVFEDVDRETGADQNFREFRGRQVFLGVEGKLNNYIAYKIEGGWVNGGSPSWDDVVLEIKPTDSTSLMFGNIKAAGLENLTSTRFTTSSGENQNAQIATPTSSSTTPDTTAAMRRRRRRRACSVALSAPKEFGVVVTAPRRDARRAGRRAAGRRWSRRRSPA